MAESNMKAKYESLGVNVLKDLAKTRGIKGISKMKKDEFIERLNKTNKITPDEIKDLIKANYPSNFQKIHKKSY